MRRPRGPFNNRMISLVEVDEVEEEDDEEEDDEEDDDDDDGGFGLVSSFPSGIISHSSDILLSSPLSTPIRRILQREVEMEFAIESTPDVPPSPIVHPSLEWEMIPLKKEEPKPKPPSIE
jgi:hypothetical protein